MEALVLWVRHDIAIDSIGHEEGPRYAPLIMTFFFFILVCNLLGLLPWGVDAHRQPGRHRCAGDASPFS